MLPKVSPCAGGCSVVLSQSWGQRSHSARHLVPTAPDSGSASRWSSAATNGNVVALAGFVQVEEQRIELVLRLPSDLALEIVHDPQNLFWGEANTSKIPSKVFLTMAST